MKKYLVAAVLGVAGLSAVAATCQVVNTSLTEIDSKDVFAGEIRNDSGFDILNHSIRVAFLNDDNQVVEVKTVDGCLRSWQDGTSNFFSARATTGASQTDTGLARLANLSEDDDFSLGQVATSDLAISNIKAVRDGDSLTVTGKVKNNDNNTVNDAAVCVVVRDDNDPDDAAVIVTAKDDDLGDLDETDEASFSVTIALEDEDGGDATHVDVHADGIDDDDVPVAPESVLGTAIEDAPATATPGPSATPTLTSAQATQTAEATP